MDCIAEGYYFELFVQERLARQMLEAEVRGLRSAHKRMQDAMKHLDVGIVMYEATLAASTPDIELAKVA